MAPMRKGAPTGFKDRDGKMIRVGDRIRNVKDGLVMRIDKYGGAVAPAATRCPLKKMNLSDWELYAGDFVPVPADNTIPEDHFEVMSEVGLKDLRRCHNHVVKDSAPVQVLDVELGVGDVSTGLLDNAIAAARADEEKEDPAPVEAKAEPETADIRLDVDDLGSILTSLESAVEAVTAATVAVNKIAVALREVMTRLKDAI